MGRGAAPALRGKPGRGLRHDAGWEVVLSGDYRYSLRGDAVFPHKGTQKAAFYDKNFRHYGRSRA